MIRRVRGRRSLSSDSGFIGVGTVIAIALAAFAIALLVAAFEGNPTYYGSVSIPSQRTAIQLDNGDVDVSYAAQVDADALTVPQDLSFVVRSADGEVVEASSRSGQAEDSDAGPAELIASVDVPEDGIYFVDVQGTAPAGAEPALAFGLSPTGAVRVRFDDVVDELKGPTGVIVLAALVALFLIPRVQVAIKRRNRKCEGPIY
jgi:hypothetical protein